jgi:hypothetical protein
MTADVANMELLQSAVTAEVQKLASKTDGKPTTEIERDMTDQMVSPNSGRQQLHHLLCAAAW